MEQIQRHLGNSLNTINSSFWEAFNTQSFISDSSGLSLRINVSVRRNTSTEIEIIRKIRNYSLAWPLILTVTYENDLVFIESEMPNIWGEGDTLEEAKQSFEHYFLYEFESYKNAPIEKMDHFAQEELKLYKALLGIS